MIAALITALALASDPISPAKPPPAPIPAPPPLPAEPSPVQAARTNLDQAQQIFAQSCGDRAYGAYDDLCEQLSIRVRQYRMDLERLERAARSPAPGPKS